jgi:hypothetical protein
MTRNPREWITAGLPAGAYDALAAGLPASRLWSLLMEAIEARASARTLPAIAEQWASDRFVQPGIVDQRSLVEVDRHLLAAAASFESIELSPVAPLGVCSVMGRASQNKVLSALRGTEVVADPTNVLALECARRLKRDPATAVRLATSHRCVRTQEVPKQSGFTATFRIFCLATAGIEQENHAFVVDAVAGQIRTMLNGIEQLAHNGFAFSERRVTVFATEQRSQLGDRIAEQLTGSTVTRAVLDHPYYTNGLRFQIAVQTRDGADMPFVDGGVFDWVAKLTSNRRAVYVGSGMGSQLVPLLFRGQESLG